MKIHKANERGGADHGWLRTKHSFSFAGYYNKERMGFGALRVLNEDFIEAGKGFGSHPHDNMEIVSIVLGGVLEHKDSMGNHGTIKAGEIQAMTAGTGVVHSEHASKNGDVHLLQIWIEPRKMNLAPGYDQKSYDVKEMKNKFLPIVSSTKSKGTLHINQDAGMLLGDIEQDKKADYTAMTKDNGLFVFVIDGKINLGDSVLDGGDSAEIKEQKIMIKALKDSRVLVIDVPLGD